MAKKWRIEHDLKLCIGNRACLKEAPAFFYFKDAENKAYLKSPNQKGDLIMLENDFTDEEAKQLLEAAHACPVNVIQITDLTSGDVLVSHQAKIVGNLKEVRASYNDDKEFAMDPKGYFLIRINKEKKEIEIGFCPNKNEVSVRITGKTPREVYHTAIREGLVSRLDHAAYLGREVQKAFDALQTGKEYVQDDEVKF
ncbi:MAG: DUF4346 domain-containing protein [Nanoarchaeota archaeon]